MCLGSRKVGYSCGWGRRFPAISDGPLPVLILEQNIIEPPFHQLNAVSFNLTRVRHHQIGTMLARARRGQWAREAHEQNDEKSRGWFIPCNKSPRLPEITIKTEHDGDMGIVTVRMQGECITSFHFSIPWPKDRSKTHTIRARIGYQSSVAWHWQGGLHRFSTIRRTFDRRRVPYPVQEKVGIQNGTLSTELGAILDGNYCISKSRHILQPGFQRSHCSWEDFPERQEKKACGQKLRRCCRKGS